MSYRGNFVEYYDKIFSKKQYSQEVDYILEAYSKHSDKDLKNILDFGCGTGTHALLLSKKANARLSAYDQSSEMIQMAKQKIARSSDCTFTDQKEDIAGKFDLFISMFYVVNHITDLNNLEEFFSFASSKLEKDGIFVFDCWNAIAALKDPPYSATRERYADENIKIMTTCLTDTDLINSFVRMKNVVKILENDKVVNRFEYNLEHTLWTPYILKEMLQKYNFELISVNKTYDINKEVNERDYKMAFVCRYRGDS